MTETGPKLTYRTGAPWGDHRACQPQASVKYFLSDSCHRLGLPQREHHGVLPGAGSLGLGDPQSQCRGQPLSLLMWPLLCARGKAKGFLCFWVHQSHYFRVPSLGPNLTLITSQLALFPGTLTLGIGASTYESWWDTIQSLIVTFQ